MFFLEKKLVNCANFNASLEAQGKASKASKESKESKASKASKASKITHLLRLQS
jgi:hypothetical protein